MTNVISILWICSMLCHLVTSGLLDCITQKLENLWKRWNSAILHHFERAFKKLDLFSLDSHFKIKKSAHQVPALSSLVFKLAVVDDVIVALIFTGTKPSLAMSSSWLASAQTLNAMKKPLAFVCARTLYGVSTNEILASASGALFLVWTRPVSTWSSHVQASHATFSVPLAHILEQSKN